MDNSVAIQLQAMQLNYAREMIAQAKVEQPPAVVQPGQTQPAPVPDVILELSLAAQQLTA